MSKDLRKAVIKLAHENPELRKDLLPLLKEARSGFDHLRLSGPDAKIVSEEILEGEQLTEDLNAFSDILEDYLADRHWWKALDKKLTNRPIGSMRTMLKKLSLTIGGRSPFRWLKVD
jgi:hypothetical protein